MSMVARPLLTNAVAGPSRGAGASQIGRYRASEHTSRGLSGLASRLTYPGRAAATDCSASSDNIERFLASGAAAGIVPGIPLARGDLSLPVPARMAALDAVALSGGLVGQYFGFPMRGRSHCHWSWGVAFRQGPPMNSGAGFTSRHLTPGVVLSAAIIPARDPAPRSAQSCARVLTIKPS